MIRKYLNITLSAGLLFAACNPAGAETSYDGVPGSPSATQSLDTRYLPPPVSNFGGQINLNATQSKPYWNPTVVPKKDAPNVLLILTDDVGFGAPSTFGGIIPTPNLDRIAQMGLRYTNFHSTALCSPSRAALITGRNHHSAGFGVISEQSTGFPGYDSVITRDKGTVAEVLKQNGYNTSWFGKDHNTPVYQTSQLGPFEQWPNGLGFQYFYGFIGGDTSQWQPNLFRNTTQIYPYVGKPGWNLTTAMADDAVQYVKQMDELDPKKKFLLYYCPGGTHAPHHAPREWIEKFHGKFDMGWNALRDQIFANQKKLGVIPQDAELTPWPKDLLPEWNTLSADQKKLYTRQVEVYAAYLAYTDYEIGRVIKAIEDKGKLNDTLIIYISGDNGSSAEGTVEGTPNEVASFNGVSIPVDVQLKRFYDVWGSDQTYNHMSVGWSWAFDTPFKWTKQVASHFGGTRQGVAISWPGHITDAGGIRHQFHHLIDIAPTILDVAGIPAPSELNGTPQKPLEGVSMAYTFNKENAKAPTNHPTQYFEMMGDRALYHDGWIASTHPLRAPWDITGAVTEDPASAFKWELYDLNKDWTQNNDLAATNPGKLKELQDMFWVEASKYQVLPLDASVASRLIAPRPSLIAGRNQFIYSGEITGIPQGDAPSVLNKSYTISADVNMPSGVADGMLVTSGGRFGGFGMYVLKSKPVFVWNMVDLERVRWEGKQSLTPGRHTITFDFQYEGGGNVSSSSGISALGRGGTGRLKVDGTVVATQKMPHTLPLILQWDESFDVGADTGTPVEDQDYKVPFKFNGKLNNLTVNLRPIELSKEDRRILQVKGNRDNAASE